MHELIRASAGSGKTFRLSGHFLRQIFLDHRPETILATTFTRKAAGEILGRVLTRLATAASSEKAAAALTEFLDLPAISSADAERVLVQLTRNLHRMRVCTLDSFFQQVARSLTLELGLTPGWSIIDEHIDRELREQAIDAVLSQHLPQDAQQLMQMLAKGRSKRSVRDLIDDTVSNYHELFLLTSDDAWDKIPKGHRLTNEQKEGATRDLYAAPLPTDSRFIKARSEDVTRFQNEEWDDFITKGLAAKVLAGEPKYYGKAINDEVCEIYGRLLGHAQAELLERLSLQMKAIRGLMTRFDQEYSALRAEHGWLGFGDVTRVLAKSVSAASGARMNFRLDSSIRNLLLDEFQDTSSDQWKILRRLAATLLQHGQDSSFFCVGDGKQAIYGWRGGMAEILDAVPEAVPGIRETTVFESRRSSPAVMEAVNRVFQNLAAHENLEDYQEACQLWSSKFPAHSTAYPEMRGHVVFRTSPTMPGETADDRRGPWFQWVAQQIRDMHQQTPGAEIGVLTRKNATVARLVHELTLLGVPASEEGGTPPVDSPAVLAVLSLLQMAAHPACTISRFHVAQSPLGSVVGLTDWRDNAQATLVAMQLRGQLMDDGYGKTLQWLSESVRDVCSARDRLRMAQIVSEAWLFDETGSLNPGDFVRLLENSKFQKSDRAPVRVMTIHQSKGLEFDRVVLPEIDGLLFQPPQAAFTGPGAGEAPDRVCVWTGKALRSLLPEPIQKAFEDTIRRQVNESLCLFYVALTRAKHCLTLLSQPVDSKKIPRTYAGLLLASLSDQSTAEESSVIYETGDPLWFSEIPHLMRPAIRQHTTEPRPAAIRLAPMPDGRRRGLQRRAPSRHDERRLNLPDVSAIVRRDISARSESPKQSPVDPRIRGNLFHAWFECLEWLAVGEMPAETMLRQKAVQLLIADRTVEKLLPEFLKILQRPAVRAVFDPSTGGNSRVFAEWLPRIQTGEARFVVDRERAFVLPSGGELVQGTIDRLVQVRIGGRTMAADIVDFKTDRITGETAAWVQNICDQYRPQLAEYRIATGKITGLDPARIQARLLLVEAGLAAEV